MSKVKILAGTRIYLTKKNQYSFHIQPGNVLLDDNLYVAYDVKINGVVVIPKDTRVVGDWITETNPTVVAQLQLSKIYLFGSGQGISADSHVIEAINDIKTDVSNIKYLVKKCRGNYKPMPINRIKKFQCNLKSLNDGKNSLFMEIFTNEIPIIITKDLTIVV